MKISEIKNEAKKLNKNNYLDSNLIILFSITITAILTLLPFTVIKIGNIYNFSPTIKIIILFFITFIFILFNCAFLTGEKSWYSGKVSKSRLGIKRLLFWYKPHYSVKAFFLNSVLFLLKTFTIIAFSLPSAILLIASLYLTFTGGIEVWILISMLTGGLILLIIAGIFAFVFNQYYFLAEYLYINNPKLKIYQVIKRSKNLINGHLYKIVRFKLSFIPAFLCCTLIFPLIIIRPRYKQSCCILAKELCI